MEIGASTLNLTVKNSFKVFKNHFSVCEIFLRVLQFHLQCVTALSCAQSNKAVFLQMWPNVSMSCHFYIL